MPILCKNCGQGYAITKQDLQFLKDLSPVIGGKIFELPPPTHCHDCREQRRLAQANQLNLYERKCDLTGSSIISNYHPKSPYRVYRQEDWYSGKWDPVEYGRSFDFSRSFFEQWQDLSLIVPRPAMHRGFQYDENADYTNYAGKNKNCYLIFDSDENRDCYYSYSLQHSENCMECFRLRNSELCYECIDSVQCYNCAFLQDCSNCSDSACLKNCIGCKKCIFCSNLQNKEYYIKNAPCSKEEFAAFRSSLGSYRTLQDMKEQFARFREGFPQKHMHGMQNEDVFGDYLTNCKNAYYCFDSNDLWDCRYVFQAFMALKNSMDAQECGDSEKVYESCFCGYNGYAYLFCSHCLGVPTELLYCLHCPHSKNLFGCVGVQRKQYGVLNRQYTKEEYEELVPKIIEHMKVTGEWGEFFPIEYSSFAYNETLAQDYFPLTKDEVLQRGWRWLDEVETRDQYLGPEIELPDTIAAVPADICKKILTCQSSRRQYKIIPQELELYKKLHLPLPRKCFFERHKERMNVRNRRRLFARTCGKCSSAIQTTYVPDGPESIYCESCYLQSLS